MHVLSAVLLALSANSDAFVIGISYGSKKIYINLGSTIVVSLIAGLGTLFSMLSGCIMSNLISLQLESYIGSSLLILFGIYMLICTIQKKRDNAEKTEENYTAAQTNYLSKALNNPETIDTNRSNTIEFKESLALGSLLCINNLGLGIGASFAGVNPFITSFFSFLFSIVFLQAGYYLGKKIVSKRLYKYSDIISALIIIILGLYNLFF